MQYFNFLRNPWRYFPVQLVVKKDGSFVCNHRQTREAKTNADMPLQRKWRHCKKAIATKYLQREAVYSFLQLFVPRENSNNLLFQHIWAINTKITAFQSASWIIPSIIVTTSQTRWLLRTQGIFPRKLGGYLEPREYFQVLKTVIKQMLSSCFGHLFRL